MPKRNTGFLFLLTLALPSLMVGVDLMIIGVAAEPMSRSLHIGMSTLQWIIAGYAIGNASFYVASGKLADIFGPKRILMFGQITFALASIGVAISTTAYAVIIFRILQGFFGAMIIIGALTFVVRSFEPDERGMPTSAIVAGTGLGFGVGPILGGILVHYFSWRMAFWINIPVGLIGVLCIGFFLKGPGPDKNVSHKIDYLGIILLAASMITLTVFLSQGNLWGWTSDKTLITLASSIVLFILLILVERKIPHSLIQIDIFKTKNFLSGSLLAFFAYFVVIAWLFIFGVYLQRAYGFEALHAGLAFLPFSIIFFLMAPVTGKLIKPLGVKPLVVLGFVSSVAAFAILGFTYFDMPYWVVGIGFGLVALGFVLSGTALVPATVEHVDPAKAGVATGKMMMIRWFGSSLGAAVITTIFEETGLHFIAKHVGKFSLINTDKTLPLLKNTLLGFMQFPELKQKITQQAYTQAHLLLTHSFSYALRCSMWVLFAVSVLGLLGSMVFLNKKKRRKVTGFILG